MGKKKKFLIGAAVVAGVAFIGAMVYSGMNKPTDEIKYLSVGAVEQQGVENIIYTNGKVVSKDSRNIVTDIGGKIKAVYVKEGDKVKKGDVLFELDAFDLNNQLKATQIKLDIDRETLNKITGQSSKSYAITEQNAKLAYDDAKRAYSDKEKLYQAGAVSKIELDAAKMALDKAKNDYDLAKSSKTSGLASDIKIQKKQVESTQVSIEKLKNDLSKVKVVAPIDGTISQVNIKVSDYAVINNVAMVIEDSEHLQVSTNINEYDVMKVSLGQNVNVKSEGTEKVFNGKVAKINSAAEIITSGQSKETVVGVKVDLMDKPEALKPNFSVQLEIVTAKADNVLTVPYEAIYQDVDKQYYVFVVGADSTVKKVHITKGIQGDVSVEIKGEGIKKGDSVVLNPTQDLQDGDKVKGREE